MKTLYITDLDGTLLNNNAELSDEAAEKLNKLIAKGISFSVATARTAATVIHILQDVDINIPIVLMNGVAVYDLKNNKYIKANAVSDNGKNALLNAIEKHINDGFIYTLENEMLATYYECDDNIATKKFIAERYNKYKKKFTFVDSFRDIIQKNIIYFSVSDKKEKLEKAYAELSKCKDLHIEFYIDQYNENNWYLEVAAADASKKNGVIQLKKLCGFDKVVSFGDNLNDLPMFEISDECYAVSNAKDEVKEKATAVIGANTENGVPEFLESVL